MRRYETFIICDPDISESQRAPVLDRVNEQIGRFSGFLVETDEWGSRKLAYMIKKKTRGYYVRLDYCGPSELVDEMERFFRIDDRVMKYMSVLLDGEPDVEKIKEDMAAAERQKKEAAEAAAAAAAAAAAEAEAKAEAKAEGEAKTKTEAEATTKAEAKDAPPADADAPAPADAGAGTEATAETEASAKPDEPSAGPQKEVE